MKKISLNKLKILPYKYVIDNEEHEIFFNADKLSVHDVMILFKTEYGLFEHIVTDEQFKAVEIFIKCCDWTEVYNDNED